MNGDTKRCFSSKEGLSHGVQELEVNDSKSHGEAHDGKTNFEKVFEGDVVT